MANRLSLGRAYQPMPFPRYPATIPLPARHGAIALSQLAVLLCLSSQWLLLSAMPNAPGWTMVSSDHVGSDATWNKKARVQQLRRLSVRLAEAPTASPDKTTEQPAGQCVVA
jgi:hypothetical protein